MTEPINIEYGFTEQEYVSGVRAFNSHNYHTTFQLFLSGCCILLGLFVLRSFGITNLFGLILTGFGLFLFAANFIVHFVSPGRSFRRNPTLRQSWNVQFSEDGVSFSTSNAASRIDWSFYKSVLETPDFYFLLSGEDSPTVIKKRAFIDKTQEGEFRELIKRKINPKIQFTGFLSARKQTTTQKLNNSRKIRRTGNKFLFLRRANDLYRFEQILSN